MHRSRILRTSTYTPTLNCNEYVTKARDDVRIEVGGGSCAALDQKQIPETCPDGQTRRAAGILLHSVLVLHYGYDNI